MKTNLIQSLRYLIPILIGIFGITLLLSSCKKPEGPRILQMQSDLGIVVPWGYKLVDFQETWTDTMFHQNSVLTFNEGDTKFITEQILKSDFYAIFPFGALQELSLPDQEKFHSQLIEKRQIGYWLPNKKGFQFFCPAFSYSITDQPVKYLRNYNNKGLQFIALAQLDTLSNKLQYTYQSFTTPQKEWKKWNEKAVELKEKAKEIEKKVLN